MTDVTPSSEATLRKYGLVEDDWWWHFKNQKGCCGVCGNEFTGGQINIDHEHVKNWKKMPPELRRIYVRGLCCWQCNRFRLFRGATSKLAHGMYTFLKAYEERRDAELKRFHSGLQG